MIKFIYTLKNLYKAKYQFLINKQESTGLQHFNDSKDFIENAIDMDDVYKNIEEYNPNKKRKILIVFDNMIPDMLSNKKLNPFITELFIRGRKLNISIVFITQSYFSLPKNIRINYTHYLILKTINKQELQQIAFNHSSDIDFMNLYKKCTEKPYSFLVIDTTLASDNPSFFKKKFLERISKLIMTIGGKIRDENLQYDINKEAAKISVLQSAKINKYY